MKQEKYIPFQRSSFLSRFLFFLPHFTVNTASQQFSLRFLPLSEMFRLWAGV